MRSGCIGVGFSFERGMICQELDFFRSSPQLLSPPTSHCLLRDCPNLNRSWGQRAWLMVSVEVSLQGHRTRRDWWRSSLTRNREQSNQRKQLNEFTSNLASLCPCTILNQTPCQPIICTFPPGDRVYIRSIPFSSGAKYWANNFGYLYRICLTYTTLVK